MAVRRRPLTTVVVCFQPLPDSQYNGNPESVGYRIKYWRPDLQAPSLTQVINDRLEREFTIEGLEEWTEYELQMQAFNAIGAGPWSAAVRGRTRESGELEALPLPPPGGSAPTCVSPETELRVPRSSHCISLALPPPRVYADTLLTQ